jgi:hypothetical protein
MESKLRCDSEKTRRIYSLAYSFAEHNKAFAGAGFVSPWMQLKQLAWEKKRRLKTCLSRSTALCKSLASSSVRWCSSGVHCRKRHSSSSDIRKSGVLGNDAIIELLFINLCMTQLVRTYEWLSPTLGKYNLSWNYLVTLWPQVGLWIQQAKC